MKGHVHKRCSCPATYGPSGKRLACRKDHGSWSYTVDLGPGIGTSGAPRARRQTSRAGFPTRDAAEAALAELLDGVNKGTAAHDDGQTVEAFLHSWLLDRRRDGLRMTTARSYRQHIDDYLVPHLGRIRLRDLRPGHVSAMLAAMQAGRDKPLSPATVRRIHATLRSALATARRRRLVSYNAAAEADLPAPARSRVHPWEPAELGAFLDHAATDRWGPLFELIAATGLRRGEAVGLRWADVDLDAGTIRVRQQIVQIDSTSRQGCPHCGAEHVELAFARPKTASGEDRLVDLDAGAIGTLIGHRLAQDEERTAWGQAYTEHGLVFAREDGNPIPPERVSKRFRELIGGVRFADDAHLPDAERRKLRPTRLHDLRHAQASLMLAAGVPIAVVSKRLGHSSIGITADTYSHLLDGVGRAAADAAMALVPRARTASVSNP
jgi:integrase